MENIKSTEMLSQVRVAHRMLAAYYQRIFQLLTDVTGDERLGLNFYVWLPAKADRPCRLTTNVFDRAAWDLLPGLNTHYIFYTGKDGNKQLPGEWLLDLSVIGDTGIYDNDDVNLFDDALSIKEAPENSRSVLRCYLYAANKKSSLQWYEGIWNAHEYGAFNDNPIKECVDTENEIYASGFEIPLEELTSEGAAERLILKIIEFRDSLIPKED